MTTDPNIQKRINAMIDTIDAAKRDVDDAILKSKLIDMFFCGTFFGIIVGAAAVILVVAFGSK